MCGVSVAGIGSYLHKFFIVAWGNQSMAKETHQLK